MNSNRKYPWRESTLALPAGQWVNRPGGVKVFQHDQLSLDLRDVPDIAAIQPEQSVWDTIAANLAAEPFTDLAPVTGDVCDDCGCLLAPSERCPNCLVWALKAEREWERQRDQWSNRHIIWNILDARKVAA